MVCQVREVPFFCIQLIFFLYSLILARIYVIIMMRTCYVLLLLNHTEHYLYDLFSSTTYFFAMLMLLAHTDILYERLSSL